MQQPNSQIDNSSSINSTLISDFNFAQYSSERQKSNPIMDCNPHQQSIPYTMPNIVNNTFHSNFDASLLPFTFNPPPSRFFSMLHHHDGSESNHYQQHNNNEEHNASSISSLQTAAIITTPNQSCSNCPSHCSNHSQQQTITCGSGNNVFVPNQSPSSCNTSNSGLDNVEICRTTRSSSFSSNNSSTQQSVNNKNQELLDAPASVLLLEPPSLSTIIDDHHPTIPTSDYHLKRQHQIGPNNNPSLPATTPPKYNENKKKRGFSDESDEISVENCDENVCLVCGCEEDKIEAELRLQDKLERKSNKRRMDGDDEDEQMSDDSPLMPDINSTKKRKKLTQLENLEALESVLRQLEPDCVLCIFQFLNVSGKDYWFSDIRNMYGRFRYNNQVLPLFKFVTIEQYNPLSLDESNSGAINCNIQSLSIERRTNQPLECESGYLHKVGNSLKTFSYYNRGGSKNIDNTISVGNQVEKASYSDVMDYLSSEDEKDLSSFELIEDENSHIIGLKRRARSEGSCFLKEVYRNCRVLEKLKIVDIKGYVPFKISMRPGTNRPIDFLAFTNTLTKIRLFNCMLPNHSLQAISKMTNLKSLHFEKIFVSDPSQYDALLKLRNLEVLKIQVAELPAVVFRSISTSFPKLKKLFINVLSNGTFDENLKIDQLRELQYLALVSHFKVDLLSVMRNCVNLKHLQLGFDVCFNHIFPNDRLTSCTLRNVFVSPDRSKVLIQNNTLVSLKLSPASIRAAQKEISFIKQQRQFSNKPTLSITEFSQ